MRLKWSIFLSSIKKSLVDRVDRVDRGLLGLLGWLGGLGWLELKEKTSGHARRQTSYSINMLNNV